MDPASTRALLVPREGLGSEGGSKKRKGSSEKEGKHLNWLRGQPYSMDEYSPSPMVRQKKFRMCMSQSPAIQQQSMHKMWPSQFEVQASNCHIVLAIRQEKLSITQFESLRICVVRKVEMFHQIPNGQLGSWRAKPPTSAGWPKQKTQARAKLRNTWFA